MKKYAPYVILFLFAAMFWNIIAWSGDMTVNLDGDQIDGPLGFLLATLFAGGGTLLAAFISVIVAVVWRWCSPGSAPSCWARWRLAPWSWRW